MFGSVVLDVAIGLSLLFLFVSLICSAIREAIETVLSMRAADLERGVRELLDDPEGIGAARDLYAHPLVYSLYPGSYEPELLRPHRSLLGGRVGLCMPVRARHNLPAYIPAANFARAFLDIILRGPVGTAPSGPAAVVPVMSPEALQAIARDMPDGRIRRALLSALDTAEGDLARVQLALEVWFDACMERVSGRYKQRTQVILFLLGLLLAGVMNIDAFSVGRALFQDKALRDGAVAQASELLPRDTEHALPAQAQDQAQAQDAFMVLQRDLDEIQFPTGWEPPPQHLWRPEETTAPVEPPGVASTWPATAARLDWLALLQMLIGWTVTAFAVMLGAPFWFDMLSRFMVVRSTVRPGTRLLGSSSLR